MTWDCALSETHHEQYSEAIRDAIVTSARREERDEGGEVHRYVPPHVPGADEEEHFEVDALPGLAQIEVSSLPGERFVTVTVYLDALPDGVTLTADEVESTDDTPAEWPVEAGDPDGLASLSDEYDRLSESLTETLALHIDAPTTDAEAPPEERAEWWLGEQRTFVATLASPEFYRFNTTAFYTEAVESIYADGHHDLAQRLGLPF